ncbi:MAG: FAD-binding protein [Oscillospiraceae bacterium]
MKRILNAELSKFTTFGMGGISRNLFIPETRDELIKLVTDGKEYRFIGGGSNLLINDKSEFDNVICLRAFSQQLSENETNEIRCSSGVRLQKLIRFINEKEYGGIEYLYSVPGLVGGAVYMNAGRGKQYNCSISDYIVSVEVLCLTATSLGDVGDIKTLTKEQCQFEYRKSIFQNNDFLILSVKFSFPNVSKEESRKKIAERLEFCKKTQDYAGGNFGSVFSTASPFIMNIVRKLHIGKKDGVHFSAKAYNWLINEQKDEPKQGGFDDTLKLINKVMKLHRLFHKPCQSEVVIWK